VQFKRIDERIEGWGTVLVDHMDRIHNKLTCRIVDLETPEGRQGGGGGSRSDGGVPLAS
jgi:hypothetical protein